MVDHTQIAGLAQRQRVDTSPPTQLASSLLPVLLLVGGVLLLYVYSLAPTVTWGDDATLQLAAVQGRIDASAGGHPAWVAVAHLLSRLPVREPAYGVNLASAIPAALAVGLLFATLRALRMSLAAALAGGLALAVSHTFWLHAVRAEVYALMLATQALLVWSAIRWRQEGRLASLVMAVMTVGLGLTVHVMILLCLPALAWLMFSERRRLAVRDWAMLFLGAAFSLLPLGLLLARDNQTLRYGLGQLLGWAFFSFSAYDFRSQMFRFAPETLTRDLLSWLVFLGYQFVGLAFLFGWYGAWKVRRALPSGVMGFFLLLYLVPALFAFSYRVGDQFVFFLPSYFAFAAFVGFGADRVFLWLRSRPGSISRWSLVASLVLIVTVPMVTYWRVPREMERLGLQYRPGRFVPGAQGRYFLMWPPKREYYDARQFAEDALGHAPQDALLLADPILAAPMQYLQAVEGLRPDVAVRYCCWSIDDDLSAHPGRPVALADDDAAIYPIDRLREKYNLVSQGPLFVLSATSVP